MNKKKLLSIWSALGRHKYLITIVIGVLVIGFIDENSFLQRVKYDIEINGLKDEIRKYNAINDSANTQLEKLKRNPRYIEKIARERYFMKADDEDIFVLTTETVIDNTENQQQE
jgi:cell division protein DivIC